MGRARGNKNVRAYQRAAAEAREALEREYANRLDEQPELAGLVTAKDAHDEPYHRWQRYRQGFAPALVRRFLDESYPTSGPILDPFSGSGTVVTECARRRLGAIGVDAIASLAVLGRARFLGPPPDWPDVIDGGDLAALRRRATHPLHAAAVMLVAATTVDGEGRRLGDLGSPGERVRDVLEMMREDAHEPLRGRGLHVHGDARALPLRDAAAGGVLTSPPYISRYDYARINAPIERLRRADAPPNAARSQQVRASTARSLRHAPAATHPAVAEIAQRLLEHRDPEQAALVHAYFADLEQAIRELARVLRPSAPLWLNVAGADLKHVYVPSDLILADAAEHAGFELESIAVARRLRAVGRPLGGMEEVAPRESILKLRRREGPVPPRRSGHDGDLDPDARPSREGRRSDRRFNA
jgi:hypothetical protein